MPETGNRVLVGANDIMSIRSMPDGHNFSWPWPWPGAGTGTSGVSGARGGLPVVAFDSAKTVLIPATEYAPGLGKAFLRFGGMALSAGERAVVSGIYGPGGTHEPQGEIVAVMGVAGEVWEAVVSATDGKFVATSPLLEIASGRRRDVNIFLTAENLYLAVWDGSLRVAEVLPDNSADSLLYYMQVVGRRFTLKKFDINIGGERAGLVADSLRRYYKRVNVAQ